MPSYEIKKLQLWFSSLNDEFSVPILPGKLDNYKKEGSACGLTGRGAEDSFSKGE